MTKREMLDQIRNKMVARNIPAETIDKLIAIYSHNTRGYVESIYQCWNINLTRDE